MSDVGYAWIAQAVGAPDFLGPQRARLAPVSRIERLGRGVARHATSRHVTPCDATRHAM
jgi:hypothetical protein